LQISRCGVAPFAHLISSTFSVDYPWISAGVPLNEEDLNKETQTPCTPVPTRLKRAAGARSRPERLFLCGRRRRGRRQR
jgi:hypothetical protein